MSPFFGRSPGDEFVGDPDQLPAEPRRPLDWATLLNGWLGQTRARSLPVVPTGLRVYAIGDVHGRADCLAKVFARIDRDRQRYPIDECVEIYLGDYIDRGPDSREVVDLFIARAARHTTWHLMGNHEAMLCDAFDQGRMVETWRRCGGPETLRSYGLKLDSRPLAEEWDCALEEFRDGLPVTHRRFFAACRSWLACGSYLFVHAGIRPGTPIERQDLTDLLWIREAFLRSKRDHGPIIVHGHTPVRVPEVLGNRINLDTGAYLTGRLTCLALEGNTAAFI